MAADMKIITKRATEIVNRIAHAMTRQSSNLDAEQWPCYPVAKSLSSEYVVAGCPFAFTEWEFPDRPS